MSNRRLSKKMLRSEIMRALNPIVEGGCGCGAMKKDDPHPAGCGCAKCRGMHDDHGMEPGVEHQVSGMLSKEEALDLVSMIASRTTCPMTRAALEDTVDDLEPESYHDDSGMKIIPLDGMESDEAFGAGYTAGQDRRSSFDYTGDVGMLDPEEAIGMGYEAGMMGLKESKKLTRKELRRQILKSLRSLN